MNQVVPKTPEELKESILRELESVKYQAEQALRQVRTGGYQAQRLGLPKYIVGELNFVNMKLNDLKRDIKRSFPLPPKVIDPTKVKKLLELREGIRGY